jgi:hypothetical protein
MDMIARKTPAERLRMASSMFESGKKLIVAGLAKEEPSLTGAQIRGRVFQRLYGDCFTLRKIREIASRLPEVELSGQ